MDDASLLPFQLLSGLAVYLYTCLCLRALAAKTGNGERGWWAWVPVLDVLLLVQVAGKPLWWALLLLVPLVNIVVSLLIGAGIARARNKPAWVGVLSGVPVLGMVFLGYLAFVDG